VRIPALGENQTAHRPQASEPRQPRAIPDGALVAQERSRWVDGPSRLYDADAVAAREGWFAAEFEFPG